LEFFHAVFEEAAIHLIADGGDVAGLFSAQEIACAADFEVAHGDLKASAEHAELFDGHEAFAGNIGELAIFGEDEVAIGAMLAAANAAAELVQIGEAVAVGLVDDHGVGGGDIDARFDDGGGDEDVGIAADELQDDFFEFFGLHLAVTDDDLGIGGEFLHVVSDGLDVMDAVVNEIDLTIAGQFAGDGLLETLVIPGHDFGDDGAAIGWGDGETADITKPEQGHVQGAGDGCGGEGEDIDGEAKAEEFIFVFDTEALLFIDDDEAEISKVDIFGADAMGANDEIDTAFADTFEDGLLLGIGLEAGEGFDAKGVTGESGFEGAFVLFGQDGGGDQDGDLFAKFAGLEGSADGEFGFAKAHIAADKAIHGPGAGHVAFDFREGGELVIGFFVGEFVFELFLPGGVGGEGDTGEVFAGSANAEEFTGEIAGGFAGALLLIFPFFAAEDREGGLAFEAADVLLHLVDLDGGDVEFGVIGEFEGEVFLEFGSGGGDALGFFICIRCGRQTCGLGDAFAAGERTRRHLGEADEAGDAVIGMDDVITWLDIQEGVHGAASAEFAGGAAGGEAVEDFVVGDDPGGWGGASFRAPDHAAMGVGDQ